MIIRRVFKIPNIILVVIGILICFNFFYTISYVAAVEERAEVIKKNFFIPPLKIPIELSANFGEIRNDHFHSGMDIRTNEKVGYPIIAIADGYVARVRVTALGYGKALYIQHSNGYTSVYAHLKKFNKKIGFYVKKMQYQNESFAVNLLPDKDRLRVKQGDIIAYTGNSGNTTGPHLHFEIRETNNQKPIDPLTFEYLIKDTITTVKDTFDLVYDTLITVHDTDTIVSIIDSLIPRQDTITTIVEKNAIREDTIPPVIEEIVVYALKKESHVKLSGEQKEKLVVAVRGENGNYKLSSNGVIEVCGQIGFGINTHDKIADYNGKLGVHSIELIVDNKKVYAYSIDKFGFNETRAVNAHIDYEAKLKKKKIYQRCYLLPGNRLSFYQTNGNNGKIRFNDDRAHAIQFIVKDVAGNTSNLRFKIRSVTHCSPLQLRPKRYEEILAYGISNDFRNFDVDLHFPAYTFYDTLKFEYRKQDIAFKNAFSLVYRLHDKYTPVHYPYTLKIKAPLLPEKLQSKALIGSMQDRTYKISAVGGRWNGRFVSTKAYSFGNFIVMIDTIAPVIKPVNISRNKNMNLEKTIKIKIKDEFSGIYKYRATVDGKWILMEYDAKNDLLTYWFDEHVAAGLHQFHLTVTDKKNNTSEIKLGFKR